MKIIPTQGVPQYIHRSACVLRTEAPGRHSTQTRTKASPVVAEVEARLAIGFQFIDRSGPAAAGRDFAASVMRQLLRPIGLCSRQMSRWMTTTKSRRTPVCLHIAKERFAGWCWNQHYRSRSWSGSSAPKNEKNYVTHPMEPHACFLAARTRKNKEKCHDSCSYVLVQQYKYYLDIAREKTNPIL